MRTDIELVSGDSAIEAFLQSCGLNASDIDALPNVVFLRSRDETGLTSVIGLELYGDTALLRSFVVTKTMQHLGLGTALIKAAERYAAANGIRHLLLLTKTAASFFERFGYTHLPRSKAPASIEATSPFSELCPASSGFMHKSIIPGKDQWKRDYFNER